MLDNLIKSLEEAPVVKRGEYDYFIHPITDGIPCLEASLLREIVMALLKVLKLDYVDKIVTAEAMGIHIGTALSLATDIPLTVMRKRPYGLPGEIAVHQTTGYAKGELYLNGVNPGDRVVIVDDVCSTGGTMCALIDALMQAQAEVVDSCVVIKRGDPRVSCPYKTLVTVEVSEDRVHVVDTCF